MYLFWCIYRNFLYRLNPCLKTGLRIIQSAGYHFPENVDYPKTIYAVPVEYSVTSYQQLYIHTFRSEARARRYIPAGHPKSGYIFLSVVGQRSFYGCSYLDKYHCVLWKASFFPDTQAHVCVCSRSCELCDILQNDVWLLDERKIIQSKICENQNDSLY